MTPYFVFHLVTRIIKIVGSCDKILKFLYLFNPSLMGGAQPDSYVWE
jgi:hypothetical protein